jgi:hypothetical protein
MAVQLYRIVESLRQFRDIRRNPLRHHCVGCSQRAA